MAVGCSGGAGGGGSLPAAQIVVTTSAPSSSATPGALSTTGVAAAVIDASTICAHFASNPMCRPLPASPAVSTSSGRWAALEFQAGRSSLGNLQQSNVADPFLDNRDTSEPVFSVTPGVATIAQVVQCSLVSYGPTKCKQFGLENTRLDVPANMEPEGSPDHHYSFDSATAGGEYDFWLSNAPGVAGGTLTVGTAGFCKWGGDGTGCSDATASQIVTSLGGLDPALIANAEKNPSGTLGYALSTVALCADTTWVYPATQSDGADTNATPACAGSTAAGDRPPEGTRWFLNVSDATIDALSIPAYAKVILRTADAQHYGGVLVGTNWSGAPGLSIAAHRGNYNFMATEAGIAVAPDIDIPLYSTGLNLATAVQFCTNGTC